MHLPVRVAALACATIPALFAIAHAASPTPLACSTEVGKANINELKSKGGGSQPTLDFVEFKVLQDGVDITGWQICASDQPGSIECQDIGSGLGTWYTLTQTAGQPDDSQSVYDADTWVTYDFKKLKAEEGEVILLDAAGNVIDYIRWSNQAGICTSPDFSWDVPAGCGSCFEERDPNQKDFARGPDGTGDWGNNGDEPTEGATNDPAPPAADHFAIIHDGMGVNCQAEPVTIIAHDSSHAALAGYASLITLGTSTANGDWTGVAAGGGALVNNGNGSATYQFLAGDSGQATLLLHDSFVETVNIDVADGTAAEAFAEDPDLAFARSGFAFRVNGAPGVLPDQIAGKPSDAGYNAVLLELQAINTNDDTGACEALLTGPVNIDFAGECVDPGSCSGKPLLLNGTMIAGNDAGAVASYTTVPLDFGDATDSTAAVVVNYADAGRISLHAALSPAFVSGETLSGSTTFVVRPFGFDLSIDGGTVSAANPGALDAAGPVFTAAGTNFNVNVRAVAWEAGDDADNDGIPDGSTDMNPANNADLSGNATTPNFGREATPENVALSAYLVAPAGGVDPGLSGTTAIGGFMNGSATANALRFDEAGIIEVLAALDDGAYLGGGDATGASGHAGRFIPAFFDVTVPADGCADAGGFTYSGQDIGEVLVTAYAGGGSGVVTENYDGALGFAKDVMLSEVTLAPGGLSGASIPAMLFSAGSVSLATVSFTFTDAGTPATPIALRATDTDGVTSNGALEEGTEIHSGRLFIGDGTAIVTGDGELAVQVQTWQESAPGVFDWTVHADDMTCTSPSRADFYLDPAGYTGNLAAGETAITTLVFNAGSGTLVLSAPGSGNDGSADVVANIDSWLEFDWDGSGAPAAPAGTITFFEVFNAEEGFIESHEVIP